MAVRPVFVVSDKSPYYSIFNAEFTWAGGFATSQKQKKRCVYASLFRKCLSREKSS